MNDTFIIFGTHGRCGTKWLADCLQPAVHMSPRGEIWQPAQIEWARQHGCYAHPYQDPVEYLRWFCAQKGPKCRGAKAFPYLLPGDSAERLLARVGKVIAVYRRNLTEQFVSLAVAARAGWSKHRQQDTVDPFEIAIDQAVAMANATVQRWRMLTGGMQLVRGEDMTFVAYEDLGDRVASLREFVGLPPLPPEFRTRFEVQRDPERYRRLITNYDEINERMGERYGVLFGEPGTIDQIGG